MCCSIRFSFEREPCILRVVAVNWLNRPSSGDLLEPVMLAITAVGIAGQGEQD
jgi:hypothetical protein